MDGETMEQTSTQRPMIKLTPMEAKSSKILIAYDEIMKMPGLYILRKIRDEYNDKFEPFIRTETLTEISDKDLAYIYAARPVINPLEWLAITEFDYNGNYESLLGRFKTMYIESDFTDLAGQIEYFLKAFFITDIYFWSPGYDKRIDFDIQSKFADKENYNKIAYVTGPIEKCIEELNIDMVFYPYATEEMLKYTRDHKAIIFAFPNYGFNLGDKEGFVKNQLKTDDNVGIYPVFRNEKPIGLG